MRCTDAICVRPKSLGGQVIAATVSVTINGLLQFRKEGGLAVPARYRYDAIRRVTAVSDACMVKVHVTEYNALGQERATGWGAPLHHG